MSLMDVPRGTISAAYPWQIVSADLIGPLPTSTGGFMWILVMTDLYTRNVEIRALITADSRSIANALGDEVICRHGCPEMFLTDQGSNFCDPLMHALCAAMEIRKIRTSTYNPRCNGMTERFNKTLASILAKYVAEFHNT